MSIIKSSSIIGITALSLVIFTLVGCNGESQRAAQLRDTKSSGSITVVNGDVDLGTIRMSNGNVDIPYTFVNKGDDPVIIVSGETSCMCTTARIESDVGVSGKMAMRGHGSTGSINHIIKPGEEAKLIATYDPNAHGPSGTGPVVRDVIIKTNSLTTPTVRFRFRGNVIR